MATCADLGVSSAAESGKRKKARPSYLNDCVMDRFLSNSSDAIAVDDPEAQLKIELRVDFVVPVLDKIIASLQSRFSPECLMIVEHISSVIYPNDKFDYAVKQLSALAKLDGDLYVA